MVDKARVQEIKKRIREILMKEWDPIGVHDIPEAADEYDMYIGGVYGLIARGASVEEIARHLSVIEVERIELGVSDSQRTQVARLLKDLKPLINVSQ